MNNIKYLLTFALCFCCAIGFAQKRVSGHVFSTDGPVIMANVVELDNSNRAVSATQTDANGNFSLSIKNTANRLQISYIGYQTERMAIGAKTSFRVQLKDKNTFSEATVTATRKIKSNGLEIPEREISVAQQSLNMDAMEGLSFETAGEALQGQIAGLDIVANSGNLGAGTSMRLRGVTSINGSQEPLIVVDGYILESYDKEEFDANDMNEEKFATLLQVSPDDIQKINVLKDAAATAIWGSRGSNGVIEITTRRGARGKTRVNFGYRFSGHWQPEGMKMLDGDGYSMMLKEAYFNPKQSDVASGIVELMYLRDYTAYYGNYSNNTDWLDLITQFGQTHDYSLSVSGGGDKANFRVSGNYNHATGTVIKQSLDRFTTRLALDYFVSDRIKFVSDFSLAYTNNNMNYDGGLMSYAYQAMPNMSVYRMERRPGEEEYHNTGDYYIMPPAAGSPGMLANNSGLTSYYLRDRVEKSNPVAIANLSWKKQSTYTITPKFALEYKLWGKEEDEHQLNYRGEVQLNAYTESTHDYYPGVLTSKTWADEIDLTSNYESKNFDFNTRHQLVFRPHFENDLHSLQVLARFDVGTSSRTNQYTKSSGISGGITSPTVPGYLQNTYTSTGKSHTMSGTGSVHYSIGSKYSFDVTLRADGSTKFGSGNKWGFFPGISGRWNISDENFFKPLKKVVSMLAFRPGWGITGNASFSEGLIYNKYSAAGSYNGTQSIVPNNLRLTEIRWEKTKSWNIGVDLGLFQDLVTFNLNVYKKNTTDLLNSGVSIPSSTGFSYLDWANVGAMENQGWELYINTRDIFKVGKFATQLRFNIAQNINTVTEMDASVLASKNDDYNYANISSAGQLMKRVQIGHALGGIYGFRYKGVYAYDYDHNGYFLNENKNQYYLPEADPVTGSNINTAKAQGKTAPIVRDAAGNVVYDKNGNPLPMIFNYGGINYQFQGGDVIYEDINHDGQIDELDIVYLGGSNPKVTGGWGIDLKYGGWSLKTNFNFRIGNKIVNLARMYAENMRSNNNQCASVNHRWRKNGDVCDIPRAMNADAGASYNALMSDRYVEPGDFMRFQYFQLSYGFKEKQLKKIGLSSLRIGASGNNLIFWTRYSGVDPEHSAYGFSPCYDDSQTPRSRSFTINLNVGF